MNAGGVGRRVAEKIRGDLGKSARVRWTVAAKIPGELRKQRSCAQLGTSGPYRSTVLGLCFD